MAAEVRCPMCGKSNPADAEVCRYCRARLKPVLTGGGASGGPPADGDEPDWLRVLRSDDPKGSKSQPGSGSEPAADVPDWLSRIRQKANEPEKPTGSGLFADDDEGEAEPDWMKGLGGEEGGAADSSPAGFGDADDWLSRLGGEPSEPASKPEPGGSAEADLSGWLASLDEQDPAAGANLPGNFGEPAPARNIPVFDDWSTADALFADEASTSAPPVGQPSQPPAELSQPASSDEDDDWLSKLNFGSDDQPLTPAATPAPQAGSQAPARDSGLWADAESGGFSDESETVQAQPAEDNMDWLRGLQADNTLPGDATASAGDEPPTIPTAPDAGSTSSGWGLTGWLNQKPVSGAPSEPSEPAIEAGQAGELQQGEDIPDWLASSAGVAAGATWFAEPASPVDEPAAQASGDELPSWFMEESPGPAESTVPTSRADSAMPGWLAQEPPAQAEQKPPAEMTDSGLPSWLKDEPVSPAAQEPPAPATQSSVPSWLAGFGDSAAEPEDQAAEAQARAANAAANAGDIVGASASGDEGLPAWMRSDFGAQDTAPAPRSEPQADGLPGWFSSFESAEEPQSPAAQPDDLPFAFNPFSAPEEPAVKPAQPQPSMAQTPPEEQPGWLTSLQGLEDDSAPRAEPTPEPAKKGTGPLPFIEEGLPDWMSEFQGQPAVDASVPPLIPVEEYSNVHTNKDQPFDIDLPDWLDEEAAQRADQQKQVEAGQVGDEDLAQAELPSWVAAMRPVETAIQSDTGLVDTDQNVEKAGPLSGMRGVLPADDSVITYRKPPVYSVKLRVSEKQRGHASLFESLVGEEAQPLVLPPIKSQAPQVVLRVLVGLFLLLILAGSLLVNLQLAPVPGLMPPDMLDLYDQVESLPVDGTVLLAVDFEPGLSGEMRFASSMVIDHLMARNAQFAIVSTVPTGPSMADSLLKQVQQGRPEYDLAGRVENLGYLPGGTISLVEFARNPRGAAPRTVDGENAWEQPVLAGVDDIQKFARVIVITDRAEVGRDWVEQLQPYLGEVPLLLVSSAQAAPMLMPYVESHQVQGMVSGLMGGTLYGQQTGRQDANPAMGHYGAYQVGVLLAFLLVLIGAIFSAVASLVNRKQKNRE